jgi:hypothetical protein
MNLHAIVRGAIGAINPPFVGSVKVSTGSTVAADGTRTPTYQTFTNVTMDVQALDAKEVQHLDSLNIQGVLRGVWLNGNIEGVNRVASKGGDLLVFGGRTWLVVHVFESWDTDGWCHVAVALQVTP